MKLRSWKTATFCLAFLCVLLVPALVLTWRTQPSEALMILRRTPADELVSHLTPHWAVGSLYLVAGDAGPLPDGWIPCAGQALLRSEYPELFAAVGDVYSANSVDKDSFALPDFRGMFVLDLLPGAGRSSFSRLVHWNLLLGRTNLATALDLAEDPEITRTELVWVVKAR